VIGHSGKKKTYLGPQAKCPLLAPDFKTFWIFSTDYFLKKVSNVKFWENALIVSPADTCGQTDGRTDGRTHATKIITVFREYGNAFESAAYSMRQSHKHTPK
jgi:hypothetical protein